MSKFFSSYWPCSLSSSLSHTHRHTHTVSSDMCVNSDWVKTTEFVNFRQCMGEGGDGSGLGLDRFSVGSTSWWQQPCRWLMESSICHIIIYLKSKDRFLFLSAGCGFKLFFMSRESQTSLRLINYVLYRLAVSTLCISIISICNESLLNCFS